MKYYIIPICLVIILLFIIAIILLSVFQNRSDTKIIMSGGNVYKKFPQVAVMNNYILSKHNLDDFVYLEKTDGVHVNLLIKNDKLQHIKEYNNVYNKYTILDAELYNDKYYIFDGCTIDGKDISELNYIDRMESIRKYVSKQKYDDVIIVKEYYPVNNIDEILEIVNNTEISTKTKNKIDGVIMQLINKKYFESPTCYKVKRSIMNTIDFELLYDEKNNIFKLYLIGYKNNIDYNCKLLPKLNYYVEKDIYHILFDNPYYDKLYEYFPSLTWNTTSYTSDMIKNINTLTKNIIDNPNYYNKRIIEMSLTTDHKWVALKDRTKNKPLPNGYFIGLSNIATIFSPLSTEHNYFNNTLSFESSITTPYHEYSRLIRKYIIEKFIRDDEKSISLLDLCGGRGGDLYNMYNNNVSNIVAIDSDKEALTQYVSRFNNKYLAKQYTSLINNEGKRSENIYLNVIHYVFDSDEKKYDELYDKIIHMNEYTGRFDIVLMNFAFHYLCENHNTIKLLSLFIKKLLKKNGKFIMTCFDGDRILQSLQNDKAKISVFDISKIEEKGDTVYCNMALPTIDKTGYRKEPLVTASFVNDIDMKIRSKIYPMKELQSMNIMEFTKINDTYNVKDYLDYIVVYEFIN